MSKAFDEYFAKVANRPSDKIVKRAQAWRAAVGILSRDGYEPTDEEVVAKAEELDVWGTSFIRYEDRAGEYDGFQSQMVEDKPFPPHWYTPPFAVWGKKVVLPPELPSPDPDPTDEEWVAKGPISNLVVIHGNGVIYSYPQVANEWLKKHFEMPDL
ncbi:hypothetical protein NJL88_11535 [Streptomyces sp. DK15]|uniref:hypothetical protein n=1 Tax=Streptomyces sp. DK15 TaxID=2957499 RepID=UPI0029B9EC2E|nr:hypothetical protein [Streptomyces sp. DK15]MDX2390685.1 hypothetical protein [Streptomyces sp. DK15]